MMDYMKPTIVGNEELAEGVYAASGTPGCDSKYMKGVYAPAHLGWDNTMKDHYGCMGCPAYTDTGCGLQSHYEDSNQAGSYDTDAGHRMPTWEEKGYQDDDIVNTNTHF